MLFERQIPYRPDWEKVVIPVVDYLCSRADVDPARIAIIGLSMCGEAVVRAAAFEHRLAAVVPDPGVVNAWLSWPAPVRDLFAHGATKAEVNCIWQKDIIPKLDLIERFTEVPGRDSPARRPGHGRQVLLSPSGPGQDVVDHGSFGLGVVVHIFPWPGGQLAFGLLIQVAVGPV